MPSKLQEVAANLVGSLQQIPGLVARLHRTARELREQAAWIRSITPIHRQPSQEAIMLEAVAKLCEDAAREANQVPEKALTWANAMVAGTSIHSRPPAVSTSTSPDPEDVGTHGEVAPKVDRTFQFPSPSFR